MAKTLSYEADLKGGATIRAKLVVPVLVADPAVPAEGMVWLNATSDVLRYHDGVAVRTLASATGLDTEGVQDVAGGMVEGNTEVGITVAYDDAAGKLNFSVTDSPTVGGATPAQLRDRATHTGTQASATILDFAEAVQDLLGAAAVDTATLNFTYDDAAGTLTGQVLDSPTVGGQNPAQLQSTITAAIVNGAAATLDTLNELAAALGNDPNFAASITALINARARGAGFALAGGANSEVVTHNLGTRDVDVSVYVDSGAFEEEDYVVERTTANTVTIRSEGVVIPAGRRAVIFAKGV